MSEYRRLYFLMIFHILTTPIFLHAEGSTALLNPLAVDDLGNFLLGILAIVLVAVMPIVVIVLIYSGFLFVMARGNPQTLQRARLMLTYGLIGGVIIIGSYAIVEIVDNLVTSF